MRISRTEQQARNRQAVLTAARAEFAERGYTEAKIERIAERADLTRGAVYSNFPSKRSLYLAVLLAAANQDAAAARDAPPPWEAPYPRNTAVPPDTSPDDATSSDELPGAAGPNDASGSGDSPRAAGRTNATDGEELLSAAEWDGLTGEHHSHPPMDWANGLAVDRDANLRPASHGDSVGGRNAGSSAAGGGLEALDVASAAETFARVWLERLPLAYGDATVGRLKARSLTGVFDDERGRAALAQITWLEALLLAVALESCRARDAGRRVRLAELILTMLHGAAGLGETAPGFGDAFDVARACRHLAGLDIADEWNPPYLPYVPLAKEVRSAWAAPGEVVDELSGRPFELGDGVVVALGPGRLGGAEDAVRAARAGEVVTIVAVTDDPAETGALVRLRLTDLTTVLRRIFGPAFRPSLRLVLDDNGTLASAIGVTPTFDTETSVRIQRGEITFRADNRGAAYAATIAGRTQ
ncbi:helix-turn-helix domain containing protein [Actinoplanes sp. Pm04-4]|uniref:Helix-turn-helix domain containing protein n=1 Tax=Paractinoplanes pyxinae TaxID=2997416 RepID=A0ABT4BCU3_9ACTN|nr:helix-turn-helix domain-containing protein [Actinoplanes pyxinae]MCY1144302.1 helix-turn-helix domain containing protein [Actinoplanes pyxinae]